MFFLYFSLFFDCIFLLFALVLLLKESPFHKVNKRLAFTFILMSVCGFWLTFLNYAIISRSIDLLAYYYPVSLVIVMFIGPSIYLYIRALLGYPEKRIWNHMWPHALPSAPAIAFLLYFAFLPVTKRIEWLVSDYNHVSWQEYVINILFYIQLTFYILLCCYMLMKQLRISKKVEVNGKLTDINWLRYFFGIALLLFIFKTIICILLNSDRINTLAGLILMDVLFLYFFIHTVWETGLLTHTYENVPRPLQQSLIVVPDVADNYLETLLQTMEAEKIYLNPDCTIEQVAEKCNIPKHHLSNILNVQLKKRFTDFINEYRVQYACQLLSDTKKDNFTIEALGLDCGFGSKAAFNRAFKKHTGFTPSQFKKS